ncbi:MAG: YceI family protein [Solirubrobacterales bacterium]|nr:YceI family protein [Solirubrobacterales bacterium]MBV9917090.1 YceI family protein [Solirubrobacterales bacterium]
MSVTDVEISTAGLPVGTWRLDPTHSSASFAVKHMGVATFRGRFEKFDATLTVEDESAELVGTVDTSSIVVKDQNLQAHLGAPDFFDTERYPELTFRSTSLRREGDELIVDGELTVKGNTRPVESRGEIAGPAVTLGDVTKLGITLEAIVDRTEFGLNWNAPLPKGGFAVANDVKLVVELELIHA